MKKIILTVTLLLLGFAMYAQDFIDNALLFSRTRPGGSARIQGIGGTQVSLGGDFSSALSNPAGLGMFNRSEFSISPAYTSINAADNYLGQNTKDSKSSINIPGLSLAVHFPSGKKSGYLGGTLGITLTRTNDLNLNSTLSGVNTSNSIIDYFIDDAGSTNPDNFLNSDNFDYYSATGLAYRNFLIEDQLDQNNNYVYGTVIGINSARQKEISERKGAQYQWSIAYGANFSDKLFVGATMGIATLKYKLKQSYREDNFDYQSNAPVALHDFTLNENYDISGSGVNLTIGTIYRPVNFFQLGVSLVTPTYYHVTDNYTASMSSNWNNYDYYPDDPTDDNLNNIHEEFGSPVTSNYNLTTPMKVSTGATFISKYGFISGDVEFVNYAKARYASNMEDDFSYENDGIKSEYTKAINYRVGAEFRYQKYRVRGGFNYMSDPLVNSNISRSQTGYSGGLGYRDKTFYIDFAATFTNFKGRRIPYYASSGPDPVSSQKFSASNYVITVGFPF